MILDSPKSLCTKLWLCDCTIKVNSLSNGRCNNQWFIHQIEINGVAYSASLDEELSSLNTTSNLPSKIARLHLNAVLLGAACNAGSEIPCPYEFRWLLEMKGEYLPHFPPLAASSRYTGENNLKRNHLHCCAFSNYERANAAVLEPSLASLVK